MQAVMPQDVVAVADDLGAEYAGTVTISRVADKTYDADQLRDAWLREGLDADLLPKQRQPVNDFQNACRSVQTSRRASQHGVEVKVDEVVNDPVKCVYCITRMTRDKANLVVEHAKEMRVVFTKSRVSADPIGFDVLGNDFTDEHMRELELHIRAHYDLNRGRIPGSRIRTIIRKVFEATQSIPWAEGKAYFTAIEHLPLLESVERVLGEVCNDDADFDMLKVADSHKLREQIDKHGTRALVDDAAKLMVELSERLKTDGAVKGQRIDNVLSQRAQLGAMRKRMADLIGRETEAINSQIRLLDDQILALMDRRA